MASSGGSGAQAEVNGGAPSKAGAGAESVPVAGGMLGNPAVGGAAGSVHDEGGAGGGAAGESQGFLKTLVFVSVGSSGKRTRSYDGLVWTDDVQTGDTDEPIRAIAYANGLFVAAGSRLWTSPDGRRETWTEQIKPEGSVASLAYGNGRFVGVGASGLSILSSDGMYWELGGNVTADIGASYSSQSLAFGKGIFVAASSVQSIRTWSSTLGETWTQRNNGLSTDQIAFCNDDFRETKDCMGPFNGRGHAYAGGIALRVRQGALQRSLDEGVSWRTVIPSGMEDVTSGYEN